ncbi:hypothetical protein [Streptomyces sp. B1I3]|uniref:hypothetical protein n=1 Tax=Streptomyces sp. B1I3 TaxID=3042264 RepID=UPI002786BCD4|nr:hypothetical protein [Streptomyces sp. B1I3]MDQ0792260.1 hypothetical protein [Streptomyces sp. B1I3]
MAKNAPSAGVTADYAQRVADDLAANRSDQERVRAELTRLQDELVQLQDSEQVLSKMQEVLGGSAKAAPTAPKARKSVSVPAARRPKGKSAPQKVSRTAKAEAETERKTATKKKAPAKSAAAEPTWRELIADHLAAQREPKSASEVAAALTESHPQRKVQVTVVRNTLEQGVAQGLLERSKQGRSVFYSPVAPAAAASQDEALAPAQ